MLAQRSIGNFCLSFNTKYLFPCTTSTLILLAACGASGAAGEQHAFTSRDSAGVMVVEYPATALEKKAPFRLAAEPEIRLGTQDGPPELQFTRIVSALRLDDGTTAILDRDAHEVRLFDEKGNFLRNIGREGPGPGEFGDPARLIGRDDGMLLVWDDQRGQLATFGRDGSFRGSTTFGPLSVSSLTPLKGGAILGVVEESPRIRLTAAGERMQNTARLVQLKSSGKVDQLATFIGMEWALLRNGPGIVIRRPWHYPQLLVAATPEGSWSADGTAWELVRRRPNDGSVDRILRFTRPLEPFSSAHVRELHAAELAAAPSPAARTSAQRRQEQEEYPEFIPPIWNIFADAVDRIWIAPLELPGATLPMGMGRAASHWLILDQQGLEVVGTITLPPLRRPLYADHNGVLVVTADELDVPYVEWWPFT